MDFMPVTELTSKAAADGYAVPAFCVWNAEVMRAVLDVSQRLRSPVILMSGPGEFPLLDPAAMAAVARALKKDYSIPAALHLDHADSVELVEACIDAGYTSVMLDFSDKPFERNVEALQQVVRLARPAGISVEGELGMIGRDDEISTEGAKLSVFTDPGQARVFADATGVDLLAVSFGNVHGAYKGEPALDFVLLEKIRELVSVPLVLHGGSGIPVGRLKRAISLGIVKINVASELVNTVRNLLRDQWAASKNLWIPLALADAMRVLDQVIEKWIRYAGSDGKA